MQQLQIFLDQIEEKIIHSDVLNKKVSKGTVGWHLGHVLLTFRGIPLQLKASDASQYAPKFNVRRVIVFTLGKIPKGKTKAPPGVTPIDDISKEKILAHLASARNNVKDLGTLPANSFFSHPKFGQLNVEQSIRFLEIHTQHHLKIVEDILRIK